MIVALYDRLEGYDDVAAYRAAGHTVLLASRFRPARAGVDLVLTTYTRPSYVPDVPVVGLASSVRMLSSYPGPVWQLRSRWAVHDTARWTLARLAGAGGPVAVVGQGRVGRLVTAALVASGCQVQVCHHDGPTVPRTGAQGIVACSLHLQQPVAWLAPWLARERGVLLVNSAWPGLLSYETVRDLQRLGAVGRYVVDGGPRPWLQSPYMLGPVDWTPHVAWQGERSRALRPRRVLAVLAAAAAGRLEDVADRVS